MAEAIARLKRQVEILETVQPYVERADLPRLFVLKNTSKRALEALQSTEFGPFHSETVRAYHQLIVVYRYSKAYLEEISGKHTAAALAELTQVTEAIAKAHGFDDSPYSQITMVTFTQMHKLTLQLLELNLSADLKEKLTELKPALGKVIAVARQGDTLKTYRAAIPVCREVRTLYREFGKVAASNAAFEISFEIQGLNEWYIDRSQIESELEGKRE